jgi:hypothetical protein
VKGANDLSIHLSISQLSDVTGLDRCRIAKQLKDLQDTAGERRAMLYESAEALPLVYAEDNLEAAGTEQARSAAQLNVIRAQDFRKT